MGTVKQIQNLHKRYRYSMILLKQLVVTDFKLRYQGSVLGYAWSLLRPILLFLILYLVFVKGLKVGNGIEHFPIYLLLGIVMWNFFAEITSMSLTAIVSRGDLIRKIRIPRWIIVLSSSVSALINLSLNLLVVAVFMYFNHVDLSRTILWLPLIFLQLYLFAVGVALLLSAGFVKYRDITYIWEVVLQAGFYLTPIIYPLVVIKNLFFQKLIIISPVATAMQDARYALVTHDTLTVGQVFGDTIYRLIPYGITLTVLLLGFLYFKREAKDFAENL